VAAGGTDIYVYH